VGFYGRAFGRLDGKQFIYKEPKFTHLFDFTEKVASPSPHTPHRTHSYDTHDTHTTHMIDHQMKRHCQKTYGVSDRQIETIDSTLEAKDLSDKKLYLQITYLKLHLTDEEQRSRVTLFERNTNLTTFQFQAPFTKAGSGKAHAMGVADQWKRKTRLTVEAQFPYILKRLPVKSFTSVPSHTMSSYPTRPVSWTGLADVTTMVVVVVGRCRRS
jgi:hypothetical protein